MAQTLDAKGNVISQGFSTNMSPAQLAMTGNVATNAPFSSITQVPKIQGVPASVPTPFPATNDSQVALSNFDVIKQQQADLEATQEAQLQGALSNSIFKSLGLDGSVSLEGQKAQTQQQLEQAQGLDEKTKRMNSISNQIKGLDFTDQANKQRILASPIGGITQTDLSGRNTELDRLSFIKKMDLTASLFAAQGDVDSANSIIDRQIKFKYADQEAKLKNMVSYFDINEKMLGKKGEAQKALAEAKIKDIQVKKENEATISKMIIEAAPNAPASVIANATKIKESGGSAMAVAQVLGQFGGDYLKNQLLKEQIKKVRAERIEIDTKNNPIRQDSTGLISAPNGDSLSSLPTNTLLNIGKMKLNEGQANAVAFVTRMVQSDQAINRQLSAKYNPTTIVSGLGRVVSSDASRDYNRNAEDFIRAQLRKESGAAIPDSEIEGAKKLYVASGFGQDEKDIKQAAIKRDTAIKSMIAQAGPASVQMLQYYEQVKSGSGTVMSQNPQLNTWFLQTSRAANTSTTQATSGFGFTDNQL